MSLAFLCKKGWHTSGLQNVEKVWIAEEKKKKEERMMKEYQRQLREELEVEEMQKLHEKASGKKKKQRLDWMYESAGAKRVNPDEYLMGKTFKDDDKDEDMDVLKGKVPGSTWVNRPKPSEEFQQLKNDPLVQMKAAKEAQLQKILTNPMLMKLIQDDVTKGNAIKAGKKALKKLRKQAKKLKKKQKKEARRRGAARKEKGEESSKSRGRRARSRSRSRSRGRRRRSRSAGRERHSKKSRSSRNGSNGDRRDLTHDRRSRNSRPASAQRSRPHSRVSKMTASEREARLQRMKSGAQKNEKLQADRLERATKRDEQEERREKIRKAVMKFKGKEDDFLDAERAKAYKVTGTKAHHNHLKARRHTQQTDLSSENFMSRDD